MLAKDPTFEDHESNSAVHLAIIRGDEEKFFELIEAKDFIHCQLNLRNSDGKSPLFLAIEHGRHAMFDKLLNNFAGQIDFLSKDTIHGNTALHMACI